MNIIDIIIGIIIIYAAYRGFREGIVLQLGGIIGLLLGVYLAFRYGKALGEWMRLEEGTALVVGFLCIVIGVLIAISLLGHLMRGLFKIAGLGIFDQIGGLVLGAAKMALILSLLILVFETINNNRHWVSQERIDRSRLYGPVKGISSFAFPYLDLVKKQLTTEPVKSTKGPEAAQEPEEKLLWI